MDRAVQRVQHYMQNSDWCTHRSGRMVSIHSYPLIHPMTHSLVVTSRKKALLAGDQSRCVWSLSISFAFLDLGCLSSLELARFWCQEESPCVFVCIWLPLPSLFPSLSPFLSPLTPYKALPICLCPFSNLCPIGSLSQSIASLNSSGGGDRIAGTYLGEGGGGRGSSPFLLLDDGLSCLFVVCFRAIGKQ